MGSGIYMEARDPDNLPRVLSYPVRLEVSSDPWPFFQSKASMPRNRGSDGSLQQRWGRGQWSPRNSRFKRAKEEALRATGFFQKEVPNPEMQEYFLCGKLFCQKLARVGRQTT